MVHFLCELVVTALCLKDILIVGNKLFHSLGFSEAHVHYSTGYHFLKLFAELLFLSRLRLLVVDGSGPHVWLSVSSSGAFTQHMVLVGHIHVAERYSRPGSD